MTETIDYKEKYETACLELINLRHELDQLKRLVFGSRHERFIPTTPKEQLSLGLTTDQKEITAAPVQKIEYTRVQPTTSSEKINTGRMKLPADLPRERVVIEPSEDVTGMDKIGEEITEERTSSGKVICSSICTA